MADITATVTQPQGRSALITWSAMAGTDLGVGKKVADFPDKTVSVRGTFDSATMTLKGSMNSTDGLNGTWFTLTDPQGNNIAKTSAAIEAVMENPVWIKPDISGGGASCALIVELNCVQGV